MQINYPRLLDDLRYLATFGQVGSGVHRLSFSPEDREARHWVLQRMTEAGLDAQIDGIGNVYGQTRGVAKAVLKCWMRLVVASLGSQENHRKMCGSLQLALYQMSRNPLTATSLLT